MIGKLFFTDFQAGFTSTITALMLLGGVLISQIGVASLYIGRILLEVQGRPVYLVRDTFNFNEPRHRQPLTRASIGPAIERDGYAIVEDVLTPDFCARARDELEVAIDREAEYHGGTDYGDYGMVLLCSLYGGAFVELLGNEALMDGFASTLGEGCIVYAYTSSSMPPNKTNFSRRIHVDCPRLIPGYVTNMGATILLDDFTEENGATTFLPGLPHPRRAALARRSTSATRSR